MAALALLIAVLALGGFVVCAFCVLAWAVLNPDSAASKEREYGVEFVRGLPGSGKSFLMVRRIVRLLLSDEPRPVYTNLPIKWRVLRRFLAERVGPNRARLIRELTRDHWFRFLARSQRRGEFEERFRACREDDATFQLTEEEAAFLAERFGRSVEDVKNRGRLPDEWKEALWVREAGEDVLHGPRADWIPAGAMIVIDEVQKWHPLSRGHSDAAVPLISYLSMHRHHNHLPIFLTQDETRCDKNLRTFANYYTRVRNRGDDRLAWGLRFKHLRLSALGYELYNNEGYDGTDVWQAQTPLEAYTVFHWLPKYRWVFRLYESRTHAGSRRRAAKLRARIFAEAGLREDGTDPERPAAAKKEAEARPVGIVHSLKVLTARTAVVAVLVMTGYAAGTLGRRDGADNGGAAAVAAPVAGPVVEARREFRLSSVGARTITASGEVYRIGDQTPGGILGGVRPELGAAVCNRDGVWLVWLLDNPEPIELGDNAAATARLASLGAVGGGVRAGVPGGGGEALPGGWRLISGDADGSGGAD